MPFDFEDLENSKILEFVLSIFLEIFKEVWEIFGKIWRNYKLKLKNTSKIVNQNLQKISF